MSIRNLKGPRKIVAVTLVGLGLAGVSVASAAQLTLAGDSEALVQAGVDDLTASLCQSTTIDVDFTLAGVAPGNLVTGTSFGYAAGPDAVRLTAIDAACTGKNIRVALGDDDNLLLGAQYSGTAAAGALTLSLAAGGPFGATAVSTADIAHISVTIFD